MLREWTILMQVMGKRREGVVFVDIIFVSFYNTSDRKHLYSKRILHTYSPQKWPWSSRQCVGLLNENPGFEPQARYQNKIRKVFLRRFPLSRFLLKNLRVIKMPWKVSQKIYRSESTLYRRLRGLYINTHNISGVRN